MFRGRIAKKTSGPITSIAIPKTMSACSRYSNRVWVRIFPTFLTKSDNKSSALVGGRLDPAARPGRSLSLDIKLDVIFRIKGMARAYWSASKEEDIWIMIPPRTDLSHFMELLLEVQAICMASVETQYRAIVDKAFPAVTLRGTFSVFSHPHTVFQTVCSRWVQLLGS